MGNFYLSTVKSTNNPDWSYRNKKISKFIPDNSSVLDLGCGSKDLLKYIQPSKYIGIDYNNAAADLKINFNSDFVLPAGKFDYLVCSGLLEYLQDIDHFLGRIKNTSSTYIISFWSDFKKIKNPHIPPDFNIVDTLSQHFAVTDRYSAKLHKIYLCKDLV